EAPVFDLAGLTATVENMRRDIARFDLTLNLWESFGSGGVPSGVDGYLQYSRDLFDHASARALADRLHRVYAAAIADPEARVKTMDLGGPVPRPADPAVDERALTVLAPEGDPPEPPAGTGEGDVGAPVSLRQRVLAELFAEVLDVPRVGLTDSFFELGGYSVLVVRLISRVRAVLGMELTVRDVFEASTVAGL